MKFTSLLSLAVIAQAVSGHYIWTDLIVGNIKTNTTTRLTSTNAPAATGFDFISVDNNLRCHMSPQPTTKTVDIAPGSTVGFALYGSWNVINHQGPAAIYLGKAPGSVSSWDGSGANWFKIAEWGATFSPFKFTSEGKNNLTTTIPSSTPAGEYLFRVEHVSLDVPGKPEWYVGCAQIRITGGGSGNPPKVSIPGYVSASDPGLTVDIHNPIPTSYTVPGPTVWRG